MNEFIEKIPSPNSTEREAFVRGIAAGKTVKNNYPDRDNSHEDRMLFSVGGHTFGVFDGVGTLDHGDYAAGFAEQYFGDSLPLLPDDLTAEEAATCLRYLTVAGDKQLFSQPDHGYTGILISYIHESEAGEKQLITAQVADLRLYRLRGEELTCLTLDNDDPSLSDEEREKSMQLQNKLSNIETEADYAVLEESERVAFLDNEIYQSLGTGKVDPVVRVFDIADGDVYAWVSDGVIRNVTDKNIKKILVTSTDPQVAARALIHEAQKSTRYGATKDDKTAVVEKMVSDFPQREAYLPENQAAVQSAEEQLGKKLTRAEMIFLDQGGTVDMLNQLDVPSLYKRLWLARGNYDQSSDQSVIPLNSREELEAYMIMQEIPDQDRQRWRRYMLRNITKEDKIGITFFLRHNAIQPGIRVIEKKQRNRKPFTFLYLLAIIKVTILRDTFFIN